MVSLLRPNSPTERPLAPEAEFVFKPSTVKLASGNYVTIWSESNPGGIKFRLFDPNGTALGSTQFVRAADAPNQLEAALTPLASGGFTVLWTDQEKLNIQSFAADGIKVGFGGSYGAQNFGSPTITSLSNGDLAFAYAENGNIRVWVTDQNGIARTQYTFDNGGLDTAPSIIALNDGGFLLAWTAEQPASGTNNDIIGQIFDSSGRVTGSRFVMNEAVAGFQYDVAVAAMPTGGFVATWVSNNQSGPSISARIFNSGGTPVGGDIHVSASGWKPDVDVAPSGNIVVSWAYSDGSSTTDMLAQVLSPNGVLAGEPSVLDTLRFGQSNSLAISVLANDTLVATWKNDDFGSALSGLVQRLFQLPILGTDGANSLTANPTGSSLAGLAGDDMIAGSAAADVVDGGSGNDSISTGGGADTLEGGLGSDIIDSGDGNDVIIGGPGSDLLFGGDGDDLFIVANATDFTGDTIDGGSGIDIVQVGFDLNLTTAGFIGIEGIDSRAGTVFVSSSQFDALRAASGNFALTDGGVISLESLRSARTDGTEGVITKLTFSDQATKLDMTNKLVRVDFVAGGNGNDTIIGSDAYESLSGGAGNDWLDGRGGSDILTGGAGNDTYVVDSTDLINEALGSAQGVDTVLVAGTGYTLRFLSGIEYVAALDPTRTDGISVFGNGLSQTISGTAGNDTLSDGRPSGSGQPGGELIGLGGNDTYIIDFSRTSIIEAANGGDDRVIVTNTGGNYLLNAGAAIETLSAASGDAPINIAGNEFSQVINGNDGANILSTGGGGGIDTLNGGLGDDIYRVFSTGDVINDAGGFDTVYVSGTSYFLYSTAAVEYLSTSEQAGTQPFYLVGNGASQVISGNYGNNTLNGRGGDGNALPDTLIGLYGNDTYGVFSQGDVVREVAGQGTDVVFASASYHLRAAAEIEVLSAINQSAANSGSSYTLRGNEFSQVVAGNNAANVIDGRGGNDTLVALGGDDIFGFTTPLDAVGNVDVIRDFQAGDKIGLASDIFSTVTDGGIGDGEFVVGLAAFDSDDRLIYDQSTGRIYFDADGNGFGSAILFAQVTAGTTLLASDFVVLAPVAGLPAA